MRFEPSLTALAALVALSACGGSGVSPCVDDGPVVLIPAPPAMLSPLPGATGLPSSITVQISYDPPNGSLRAVAHGTGATVDGTPLAPVPATATPPGTFVSTLSPLAPHTTYTVYIDAVYPPAQPCFRGEQTGPATYDAGDISTQ